MSNIALSHVWKHSQQDGTHLLVLIAIADAANDDGECYPGVSKLADKCRMKERNMQRIIRDLEAAGELSVDYFKGVETRTGPTNRYRVAMAGVQATAPLKSEGVHADAPVGVQSPAPNPSVEPKEKKDDDDARAREPFNIFNLFQRTFGKLVSNPYLADELKDAEKEYPPDWIEDAFKQAALANASSFKYVIATLENWRTKGRDKPRAAPKPTPQRPPEPTVPGLYVTEKPTPPKARFAT